MEAKQLKRAVLTLDVYVYGENNLELIKESKKLIKDLEKRYEGSPEIVSLHELNFGEIEPKKIDVKLTK